MKKPYDTTPVEMNTAEEPGVAYAYTPAADVRATLAVDPIDGTDVDTSTEFIPSEVEGLSAGVRASGARHASPMTAPAETLDEEVIEEMKLIEEILQNNPKFFELTPEKIKFFEECLVDLENEENDIPWDEMMQRLRQRKYATV